VENSNYFDGNIDEVRIYNRALSPEEINASYNSKVNQLYHNFTSLQEGNHTYHAHAIDAAGNENTTETRYFKVLGDPPEIEFVPPTPDNNTVTSNTYAYINVSVNDSSDTSSFIDWNNSLVGYWNFDHTNSTGVYDNSTYNNFGTFNGANFGESNITIGKYGDALEFDGSNDYVEVASNDLDIAGDLTVEAWVYPEDYEPVTGVDRRVLINRIDGNNAYQITCWGGGGFIFAVNDDGTQYRNDSRGYVTDTWYHLLGTYDATSHEIILYVNGISNSDGSSTPRGLGNGGNLQIGRRDGDGYFKGAIDEARIWNRILSWEEINASYNSKVNQLCHNVTGLNEGNYTYYAHAIDIAGNENITETRNLTVDATKPNISFDTPPTPVDNTKTTDTYAQINVTVSDSSNTSSFIDWDNSLVGYWNFEHTNSTHVFDNSTYGNNGTFQGANFGESNLTTGKYGNALEFDGSNDYVDCGNDVSLNITDEITIEAWVKTNTNATTQRVVSKQQTGVGIYNFKIVNQKFNIYIEDTTNSGYRYLSDNSWIGDGQWHHVVGTASIITDEIHMYLDGSLNDGSTDPIGDVTSFSCTNNLRIGRRSDGSDYFNGTIDEVRIWNRTLSWEEINASYNSKVNQLYHNFTGLSIGNYSYYAHAIDAAGNENATETRYFEKIIETSVNAISPYNQTETPLTINATGDSGLDNVTLSSSR